ncbi:hypothetical protein [Streptomyces atratus]|uniref:hypothetical protein n=1 Tax=Streptomyces atratus TaxID=1893 RepID=UPI00340CD60A
MRFALATDRTDAPGQESALGAQEVLRMATIERARSTGPVVGQGGGPVPLTPGDLTPAPVPRVAEPSR